MSHRPTPASEPSRPQTESHHRSNPSYSSSKKPYASRMASLPAHLPGFHNSQDREKQPAGPDPMSDIKSPTRRFFSSRRARSKSPAPIITDTSGSTVLNQNNLVASPTEDETAFPRRGHLLDSPPPMSPPFSPSEPSYSSTMTGKKRHSYSSRKGSSDYKRLSGTVNHCGRHGNDWLLGGFSVRERVRGLFKDENEEEHEGNRNEWHH
ncbi:predicted protein [Uncinocarpus reesii 1704]|uniref:Uncharacterized protein n=1 Tax=Uncinocarpus reesii (strain UAMH 1704) TaxID=336963 RepID=C4JXG8_UNCRE|nr:uncharacterized protein UREG_06341 [Uncinocarpus reesii 1704]EEP81476.1 predicted protein [Uncinocarpus reesii 1704]